MTRHPTADECARFVIGFVDVPVGRYFFASDERLIDWFIALEPSAKN